MMGQACFIDLKKTLDTLDHEIVLEKLENYGFRRKINELLKSSLSDREQYLRMNALETAIFDFRREFHKVLFRAHSCF